MQCTPGEVGPTTQRYRVQVGDEMLREVPAGGPKHAVDDVPWRPPAR
jgi:hypothetical protein